MPACTRATLPGLALAAAGLSSAFAGQVKLDLSTTPGRAHFWTVWEKSGGAKAFATAVVSSEEWGAVPAITIPFTDCDGFWVAKRHFHIPLSATNAVLRITALGADDRAVVELNGKRITSAATDSSGEGEMQFTDPGENVPYRFKFISGHVKFANTADLKPGVNEIRVYINNTFNGINGGIQPVNSSDPSEFGIAATVTYTP